MSQTVVLIPAFNEEAFIGDTVRAAIGLPGVDEVVVVDDGSVDETPIIAHNCGARVIQLDSTQGKGAALARGITEADADIFLLIDADLGAGAAETYRLLEPLEADQADMSIGVLKPADGRGPGLGLAAKLARWGIKRCGGLVVTAPTSGLRAIRRQVLVDVGGFEKGFGVETGLTIDALRNGYRIVEVSLPLGRRIPKRRSASWSHSWARFWDILKAIWWRRY